MSDQIRRADAIKAIEDLPNAYNGWSDAYDKAYVIGTLEEVPTVEPKRGKWIDAEIRHEDGVLPIQVCSECKTFYPLEYTGGGHRFCPNCGAKMKGADDE